MTEEEFLEKFYDRELGCGEFNHRNHLWLAWIYLRDYSFEAALGKLETEVHAFASSRGNPDKFHQTVTESLLRIMYPRFRKGESFEDFLYRNGDLLDSRNLLLRHYQKDTLDSERARMEFVEPDVFPIPSEPDA